MSYHSEDDEYLTRYYCPYCCDENVQSEWCGYFTLALLPSDLCCPECGTALEYDDPLDLPEEWELSDDMPF